MSSLLLFTYQYEKINSINLPMIELLKKRIQSLAYWFLLILVAVSVGTKTSFAVTPTVSRPVITNITQTSARATWTSSVSAASDIICSLNSGQDNNTSASSDWVPGVFTHTAVLRLNPGSSYTCHTVIRYGDVIYGSTDISFWTEPSSFRVINLPTSTPTPFVINRLTLPPSLINPRFNNLTATSVSIYWTTATTSDSNMHYYSDPADAHVVHQPNDDTINHAIHLNGLQPNTTYSYAVASTDHGNQVTTSGVNSFRTTGLLLGALLPRDNTPPAITSLRATAITQNKVTISWTTNEEASDRVYFSTNATNATPITNYQFNTPVGNFAPQGLRKVSFQDLSPDTVYSYRAVSKDRAENLSISFRGTFITLSNGNGQVIEDSLVGNQDPPDQEGVDGLLSKDESANVRNELLGNDSKNPGTSSSEKTSFEKSKEALTKEFQKESPKNTSWSEFDSLDRFLDDLIIQKPGVAFFTLFGVVGLAGLLMVLLFKKFAKSVVARRVFFGSALAFILLFILSAGPFISGFIYSLPYYFEKNQNDKALEKKVNTAELKEKALPKAISN